MIYNSLTIDDIIMLFLMAYYMAYGISLHKLQWRFTFMIYHLLSHSILCVGDIVICLLLLIKHESIGCYKKGIPKCINDTAMTNDCGKVHGIL